MTTCPRGLARRLVPLVALVLAATTLGVLGGAGGTPSAAASPSGDRARCPQLKLADHWYGDNAELIQQAIDDAGRCSWHGDPPKNRPYAVFDWDNTVIKNDISDQTIAWMLRHDQIPQPRHRDWHTTSRYMTDEGAAALREACGDLAKPGEGLPTSSDVGCADELWSVRKNQETTDGDEVFAGYHHRHMEAAYAWVGQILAGYTPAKVRKIASAARTAALDAPIGATQTVGSHTDVTAWIRYYPEMKDLIRTLAKAGIRPWIVSASPKEFADVWSPGVGVSPKHTLGVFQTLRKGRLSGHLEGCGGIPDGADAIMTYIDGKRCFINERIVGITGKKALKPAPKRLRPVLAGGDATTDDAMLRDATGVHVVLNRNSPELMCFAYDGNKTGDGRWAINPMFIQPLPKFDEGYPCSTTAYTTAKGDPAPVRRPDGSVIPDQEDTVFE